MSANVLNDARESSTSVPPGAEYPIFGQASGGGLYNSHLVSIGVIVALAGFGLLNTWLAAWIVACFVAGMLLDDRSWHRKIALRAIPGQCILYLQMLARSAWDALPFYVLAFLLYVCAAPILHRANLPVSSFVMVYGFYMVIRLFWVFRYLWILNFRWETAGRTFEVHEANLKSPKMAIQHVLWSYFIGNIGLVVRAAVQVVTIGGFEYLRTASGLELESHPTLSGHLMAIFLAATAVWMVAFWFGVRRLFLIYYRAHRTLHDCRPLFDCIHRIHHRAILPTPLDSGTISPAEFLITEMAFPLGVVVPNWSWTSAQVVIAFAGHLPAHDAGTRQRFPQHHLGHHKFFTVNFGLTPAEDQRFGTLYAGE